jgi:hypothetical protein
MLGALLCGLIVNAFSESIYTYKKQNIYLICAITAISTVRLLEFCREVVCVCGVVPVSRAFGHKLLKQYVVADPEIKVCLLNYGLSG